MTLARCLRASDDGFSSDVRFIGRPREWLELSEVSASGACRLGLREGINMVQIFRHVKFPYLCSRGEIEVLFTVATLTQNEDAGLS
jgi:hypothetical protein